MEKEKKPKINKMEKLRRILDNPFDPNNKKLISKDEKNLETIRRKLSGEMSKNKDKLESSESLTEVSSNLKPSITVHEEKEEKSKTKQIEGTEEDSDKEDLIEVEKVVESKPEFLEVKSEEKEEKTESEIKLEKKDDKQKTSEFIQIEEKNKPQIFPEKIISKVTPRIDKKLKIVDFKKVEAEEIYWKTKQGLLSSDKIKIYKQITIIEIWAFTIIICIVTISGLFLLRDWLFLNFHVYGDKLISTPSGTQNIHIWFGFIFAILGLIHLAIYIFSRDRDILPNKTVQDFKSFLHSGLYLIGFARREDYKTSGRFSARQRIVYIALVYILGLATITGILYYLDILSEDLALVHIIPAGLGFMVLLFHFLITIRNHDFVALKCAFIDGKIPRWYARKNSPIWFKDLNKKREKIINKLSYSRPYLTNNNIPIGKNKLNNAILKFALLLNENPDEEDIREITNRLKTILTPEQLKRILELAEEFNDGKEDENKQEPKEEKKPSKEDSKTSQESSDKN